MDVEGMGEGVGTDPFKHKGVFENCSPLSLEFEVSGNIFILSVNCTLWPIQTEQATVIKHTKKPSHHAPWTYKGQPSKTDIRGNLHVRTTQKSKISL
jgi:hypothetical protein